MDQFITREVPEPEGDEAKASHKRCMDKAKSIIAHSIKDHLIPHVSAFKTSKEVYDSLKNMFEAKNINQKITLRNQVKNVNIQNSEIIQSYFTRVSQIKEQLEAVEENFEEGEIIMNTLNGHPSSWTHSFKGFVQEGR